MGEGNSFSLFTFRGGGYPIQPWMGGRSQVSDFLRGSQVSDFLEGGPRSQIFGGGVPGLRFSGGVSQVSDSGGVPGLSKGKNFDTRFGIVMDYPLMRPCIDPPLSI